MKQSFVKKSRYLYVHYTIQTKYHRIGSCNFFHRIDLWAMNVSYLLVGWSSRWRLLILLRARVIQLIFCQYSCTLYDEWIRTVFTQQIIRNKYQSLGHFIFHISRTISLFFIFILNLSFRHLAQLLQRARATAKLRPPTKQNIL